MIGSGEICCWIIIIIICYEVTDHRLKHEGQAPDPRVTEVLSYVRAKHFKAQGGQPSCVLPSAAPYYLYYLVNTVYCFAILIEVRINIVAYKPVSRQRTRKKQRNIQ
jgi:hypothetical protein